MKSSIIRLLQSFVIKSFILFFLIGIENGLLASEQTISAEPISFDSISRLVLALIFVIIVIFLSAWLIRRTNWIPANQQSPIKTLFSHAIGTREKIVIIAIGEKQLLLGVTPQQISCLATFDTPIIDEKTLQESLFSKKLNMLMKRDL
ncbi:MAG: flagellar biosynthetic protein FliO [Pseudomonadota bacterium]